MRPIVSLPKVGPYRNQALLDLAQLAPYCMNPACRTQQHGQVVACHSNHLRHGKGRGIKAHDLPAFLCDHCHDLLDGRAGNLTPSEKDALFFEAFYETWAWIALNGYLAMEKSA